MTRMVPKNGIFRCMQEFFRLLRDISEFSCQDGSRQYIWSEKLAGAMPLAVPPHGAAPREGDNAVAAAAAAAGPGQLLRDVRIHAVGVPQQSARRYDTESGVNASLSRLQPPKIMQISFACSSSRVAMTRDHLTDAKATACDRKRRRRWHQCWTYSKFLCFGNLSSHVARRVHR